MKRALLTASWFAAAVPAILLSVSRFRDAAHSADRMDFDAAFLPAAQAIAAGASPYVAPGYVYPPYYALALAPVSGFSWAADATTIALLACGVAACFVAARSFTRDAPALAGPVVAAAAAVTLLYSWPATFNMWGLEPELAVLLCLALAAGAKGAASGFALATATSIKLWPVLLGAWLLRSPLAGRGREWRGVALAAAATVASLLAVGGPGAIGILLGRAFEFRSQPLVAYSASGAARLLFTDSPMATPLAPSALAYGVAQFVLTGWLLVLAIVVIRHPGDRRLALFNLAFILVLLLPVSHYVYLILPLPTLWFWLSRLCREPASRTAWVASIALALWWVLAFRTAPAGDSLTTTWGSFVRIFGASLAAATVSVLAAATLRPAAGPEAEDAAPATRPGRPA